MGLANIHESDSNMQFFCEITPILIKASTLEVSFFRIDAYLPAFFFL